MAGMGSVQVTFEVGSLAEAEELVRGWVLHEGCILYVSFSEAASPHATGQSGKPYKQTEPGEMPAHPEEK
jgi:hypothetical protein